MSLKDRVKKAQEARKFKLSEGIHGTVMFSWTFKKSKSGNEMFEIEFKPRTAPEGAPENYMETLKDKKRMIKMVFLPSLDFQYDILLELLEAFGAPLEDFDEEDTTFKDIKGFLNKMEDENVKVDINVVPTDTQYPNYYFRNLEDVTPIEAEESEEVEAPKKTLPKKKKVEEEEAPKYDFTRADLLAEDWTEEEIDAEYPDLD